VSPYRELGRKLELPPKPVWYVMFNRSPFIHVWYRKTFRWAWSAKLWASWMLLFYPYGECRICHGEPPKLCDYIFTA